mmetsp:Transcript_30335/g.65003  ORF Transcript_30335/g.65003 Transcript_30335/m.65003 type:complete len:354 (-) Transcript_30335:29-1090(-)|eukprot:CAMPEP_0171351884 /NCGR_PEP_ID=MMETSP0878-20121228/40096_1 /TAXON_ID=67004 /ORGANISM="Thalassiosira weissflogii, Strain CCMP1336" /LENGTH=353 /DNA_ID=CAMNT_0011857307 /DNA_START=93 /DNA_END=1154 /DNA_ORIENTATION=+
MAKQKGGKGGRGGNSNVGSKKSKGGSSDHNKNNSRNNNKNKNQKQKSYSHSQSSTSSTSIDDTQFRKTLLNQGYTINEISSDGNCLFRSLSDQLHHDSGSSHFQIRDDICNHLSKNKEEFSMFLLMEDSDEDVMNFEEYVENMRRDGEWGGNVELVAASRVYGRDIKIFSGVFDGGVWLIESDFGGDSSKSGTLGKGGDLLLSYHENDHYNSVHSIGASYSKPQSQQLQSESNGAKKKKKGSANDAESLNVNNNPQKKGEKALWNSKGNSKIGSSNSIHLEIQSATRKMPTRGAECPCGSGLKYKKCCLSKLKSDRRLAKMKGNNQLNGDDDANNGCDNNGKEYIGDFKVLTI